MVNVWVRGPAQFCKAGAHLVKICILLRNYILVCIVLTKHRQNIFIKHILIHGSNLHFLDIFHETLTTRWSKGQNFKNNELAKIQTIEQRMQFWFCMFKIWLLTTQVIQTHKHNTSSRRNLRCDSIWQSFIYNAVASLDTDIHYGPAKFLFWTNHLLDYDISIYI